MKKRVRRVFTPSPKEAAMLRLVAQWVSQAGIQPSYEEIAKRLRYSSKGYVYAMVKSLQEKGVVSKRKARFTGMSFNWREWV